MHEQAARDSQRHVPQQNLLANTCARFRVLHCPPFLPYWARLLNTVAASFKQGHVTSRLQSAPTALKPRALTPTEFAELKG